jgi:hypothetical protein
LAKEQHKKVLGVVLVLIGLLFLFVSNNLILSWKHVWPLFPLLGGIFFLKLYTVRKKGEILFAGISLFLVGILFLLFTFNILEWTRMHSLWPTFPLVGGVAFLALASTREHPTSSLIVGIAAILFALVSFLHAGGVISGRVAEPFIRLWPLLLIIAGAVVFLKARQQENGVDPD